MRAGVEIALMAGLILAACGGATREQTNADGATGDTGTRTPDAPDGSGDSGVNAAGGGIGAGTNPKGTNPSVAGGNSGGSAGNATGIGAATGGMSPMIVWDDTGWIDGSGNPFAIQGSWYSFDDCADAKASGFSSCTVRDPSLIGPPDANGVAQSGWSVSGGPAGRVCMRGDATKVDRAAGLLLGADPYAAQWGAAIGFDLLSFAQPGVRVPFDATARGITGFSFLITGTMPALGIRINVTTTTTVDAPHFVAIAPSTAGTIAVVKFVGPFTDPAVARQGSWVTTPTTLDPTQLLSIQFQVPTTDLSVTHYDFCVSFAQALQ